MFSSLYHEIIYRPLLNLLIGFHNIIPGNDIGVVIIVVTGLIRLAMAPSFHKSLQSQKTMNDLQPKLNDLREKHKDDKEAQAKAMMDLYKEHKINPLSSCLPILVQLPILIGLYQVFRLALGSGDIAGLYSFVAKPDFINPYFLGMVNLANPNIVFAVLAGATQFWQSRMMMPKTQSSDATAKALAIQTTYILPLFSVFIAWKLPAGLPLYWITTTLFAIAQQYYIVRKQSGSNN